MPSPRREQIVDVMSAVLDANLRDWTRGRRPIASVYEALVGGDRIEIRIPHVVLNL